MCYDQIEKDRIAELQSYEILDTPRDGAFDDITALAADFFHVPIAIVSLVDRDRVWFKSAQGLGDLRQIERGPGLCASAIMQDGPYIATDLRKDPNSLANPLVASENGLRFYAAAPLKGREGFNLGTLCVLDLKPRVFTRNDEVQLQRFARLVMTQMENRLASRRIAGLANTIAVQHNKLIHAATHDALTDIPNRATADEYLRKLIAEDRGADAAILLLDVDHFKVINDRYGHAVGDATLIEVARRIKANIRPTDMVARYGGEEFIVILNNCKAPNAIKVSEWIRTSFAEESVRVGATTIDVTVSGGLCQGPAALSDLKAVIYQADMLLYNAKNAGRNRIMSEATGTWLQRQFAQRIA